MLRRSNGLLCRYESLFVRSALKKNLSNVSPSFLARNSSSFSQWRSQLTQASASGYFSVRQFTSKIIPAGFTEVRMPMIMTAKEGTVDKWLVKEGDACSQGTPLCEVTLDDLTVSVEAPRAGIIAEILLAAGGTCKVDEPIAQVAGTTDSYLGYLEELRMKEHDKELVGAVKDEIEDSSKKPDVKTLLREIRHLIETKSLDQESEFAKKLLSLARKGNPDLMAVFEASYEGKAFNADTFDAKFFLDNAKEVVQESTQ